VVSSIRLNPRSTADPAVGVKPLGEIYAVGIQASLDAVRQLGERLSKALDKPIPDEPARGLQVDTETETVLGQAFLQAANADSSTILGELIRRTEEISRQLTSARSETARSALELPRAFCLALSISAAAYRQSIFDLRPSHPFWR
jgi:hypothetical protein